jgi:NADH-quinone oxidoreductase subunit G
MSSLKIPNAPECVAVMVNGQELMLPKGRNLLQALLDAGHDVPHYCYHPSLSVDGSCRLCLIEIEGQPRPEISCNMVVSEGLSIKTDSEMVESCRTGMMEFLLANHPLDCPVCDRGGECMLQRYSVEYGWGSARTTDQRRRFEKPRFDPLIDIERNRCIMCTRCVRFCDEIADDHVMGVFGRGSRNYIGTYGNGPVSNIFSGNVIDICPVGCLTSKPFRFKARVWELRQTLTTTRTCNGSVTAWTRGGELYRVTPPVKKRRGNYTIDEDTKDFISNEARFGSMYTRHSERLLTPLVRNGEGRLQPADWNLAFERIDSKLKDLESDQACILVGERSTNEEAFLLARLARSILRTPHIDWRMRFTSEAAAQAAGAALCASNGDFGLLEKKAYAATLMINGSDLYQSAPDIALKFKDAARRGHTRLGLLDSRLEPWFADHASALCLEQPEDLARVVETLAGSITSGSSPEGYGAVHGLLKDNEQGLIVLGLDPSGGAMSSVLVPAVMKLLDALGDRWHFLPVTGARNAKGLFASGAQSDRLPTGHLAEENARHEMMNIWGGSAIRKTDTPAAPALLQKAADGEFKVLFLHRTDELTTHPNRKLIQQAIDKCDFVIATDIFPSWINQQADVVLPSAVFYETNGSMADIDGTLQRMSQGCRPAGESQEDWRIIESISNMLGSIKHYRDASDVFSDLGKSWNAPTPFRLDDLLLDGPGDQSPTRKVTWSSRRARPDFKLQFNETPSLSFENVGGQGETSADSPRLLWVRHCQGEDHLGSRSSIFDELRPTPRVELNPNDAGRGGLKEGDWVRLVGGSDRPSQVGINPHIANGIIFGSSNVLGLQYNGDISGLPGIRLEKTDPPADAAAASGHQHEKVTVH